MNTLTSSLFRGLFVSKIFCLFLILFCATDYKAQLQLKSGRQLQTISQTKRSKLAEKNLNTVVASNKTTPKQLQITDKQVLAAISAKNSILVYDSDSHPKSASVFVDLKLTELEEKAFTLINEQRKLKNLKPLELDLGMLYIAREHSEEMAQYDYFSHMGRDGCMADERAIKAGITDWRGIGENIAFSQNIESKVQAAVEGWLKSAHHSENLLNPLWTRSGIGVAVTRDNKFYITQVFRE